MEITLEANPGANTPQVFSDYQQAGINRISLGVQSMQDSKLKLLGRIHSSQQVIETLQALEKSFGNNFNVDLMHGLPEQTVADALDDLEKIFAFNPPHLSWYQLTLEPNTLFYAKPPALPDEETLADIQQTGLAYIQTTLQQYEISAYARAEKNRCQHNLNYWQFGDYLGIGAGAHSKITLGENEKIIRLAQVKHPNDFMNAQKRKKISPARIDEANLIFEFMLNALRLKAGAATKLFETHTGLPREKIAGLLKHAREKNLLLPDENIICASDLGFRFLNDLQTLFLPPAPLAAASSDPTDCLLVITTKDCPQ